MYKASHAVNNLGDIVYKNKNIYTWVFDALLFNTFTTRCFKAITRFSPKVLRDISRDFSIAHKSRKFIKTPRSYTSNKVSFYEGCLDTVQKYVKIFRSQLQVDIRNRTSCAQR